MELVKKSDYENEYFTLAREQYKRLPNFSEVMKSLGLQIQEIEDSGFQIHNLNNNFGVDATLSRDSLNRTARMLGISFPNEISTTDLIFELRAAIIVAFSQCTLGDVKRFSNLLYGTASDIQEIGSGIYLSLFSQIEEKQFKLIFRSVKKIMPAGNSLYGIILVNNDWFGFEGFAESGSWRSSAQTENQANRLSQVVIDEKGEYLL